MLESYLKPTYTKLLVTPFTEKILIPNNIKPNHITALSALLGLFAGLSISLQWVVPSVILILMSGYADTLDGNLALLNHQQTTLGAIFDIVCDRIVEISIIIGLYFYAPPSRGLLSLLMLASILICITSFLVVSIFQSEHKKTQGKSFFYSVGLMERAEAFFFFIAMVIFPEQFFALSIIFIALVLLTAALHIVQYISNVR